MRLHEFQVVAEGLDQLDELKYIAPVGGVPVGSVVLESN